MAKFYGTIGYAITEETEPGIWEPKVVTRKYRGDLVRNTSRRMQTSDEINDDITVSNDISIVADPFAYQNFIYMRYVEFIGVKWKVSNVEIQYPRLILTLGGVYNGE